MSKTGPEQCHRAADFLPPFAWAIDVPVSCTEQGRWSYASAEFGSSGSLAYAELRKRKAVDVATNLKAHAIHISDQSAVWE